MEKKAGLKKWHKVVILSVVVVLTIMLIFINGFNVAVKNANEAISEHERDYEIREELYLDAKQVFKMLEQAHFEQRELTNDEKMLMDEFNAKYDAESEKLTFAETMIVLQLSLMSFETTPSSKLDTEKNRYEDYRNELFKYIEF